MSISQQLTRLAQNVGAINADTNAIFEALRAKGVNVPANAQLSDVADMIESIVPPHQNEVEIGGRWYPYVQIGNQLWTTENLDWKMSGIGIGGNSQTVDAHAWYYNNAESTYGIEGNKYGLLYTYAAANLINSALPNGWKIPSNSDFEVLLSVVNNDSLELKSTEGWEGQNGNNSSGFTAVPSGYKGDVFSGLYRYSIIHSMDLIDSTHSYALYNIFNDSIASVRSPISMNVGISIRLVKDVT